MDRGDFGTFSLKKKQESVPFLQPGLIRNLAALAWTSVSQVVGHDPLLGRGAVDGVAALWAASI